MAGIRTRLEPIDRDIAVLIDQDLSPEAQSNVLARFAREGLEEAQERNRQALGSVPPHDAYVDRVKGAPFESVKPDGSILIEFRLLDDVLLWISEQLVRRAPFRTGRFAASFELFADGALVDIVNPPMGAQRYHFINATPYSRKIERGQSPQAPDGVFEGVAEVANRRFGNSASVRFTFVSPILPYIAGGRNRAERAALRNQPARQSAMRMERQSRTPAIIVTPRGA